MYNGIGLQTARGSGTNGYVQTNRFLVKPRLSKVITDSSLKGFGSGEGTAGLSKKPNKAILEHDRKRNIELKLLVLEEKLSDQGFSDKEIQEKIEEARRGFEERESAEALEDGEVGGSFVTDGKISDTQTHQIAARKERQMETLRAALGIGAENTSQNQLHTIVASDSEDMNDEGEPAKGRKGKKKGKSNVDDTSDLRNAKKSHGNESAEDTFNKSGRHKKQRSGRGHGGDSSDSDDSVDKVVKRAQKKLRRKTTSSDSDEKDANAKRKKKPSRKSRSSRRRHSSDSSDSESDTDSSSDSDSDGGREHEKSLKKGDPREGNGSKYHNRDVREATKKPRKSLSSSESDQSDYVKKKKNLPQKSKGGRRHDSDSSSSESDSRSSSDSGNGRRVKKPLKKHELREDYKSDKIHGKSKTRHDSDDESDQEDRGLQPGRKRKEEKSNLRAEKVDIALDDRKGKRVEDGGRYEPRSYVESEKILGKTGRTGERSDARKHESSKYDTDSSSDSDGHGKRGLEPKSPKDNLRRFDGDLNDSRRVRKEYAYDNDDKSRHGRDVDGLDTLRKLEKVHQPEEEKMVNYDRVGTEANRSKRKADGRYLDEQPARKSRRQDMGDLGYNDDSKRSHGSQDRSENRISDRWGADSARDHDVSRRGSGEDRDRQGRKHRRDEEEDTHRMNNKDRERQQSEGNKREQDDRRGNKYERDGDRDSTKRARYDDSRSAGRRYDDDDDGHGRKSSDGRHDDRRSRR